MENASTSEGTNHLGTPNSELSISKRHANPEMVNREFRKLRGPDLGLTILRSRIDDPRHDALQGFRQFLDRLLRRIIDFRGTLGNDLRLVARHRAKNERQQSSSHH